MRSRAVMFLKIGTRFGFNIATYTVESHYTYISI